MRRFNIQDCKLASTPLFVNYKLSLGICPSSEVKRIEMSRVLYTSTVGSLMYAIICTRLDIAQAIGLASQFMAKSIGTLLRGSLNTLKESRELYYVLED